jgi:hypothetical protein
MNRVKNIFLKFGLLLTVFAAIVACSDNNEPAVNGATFEMESYDDFWWSKYAPDTLKFTINAEFKECSSVSRSMVLALCDGDQNGSIVSTDVAQVYVHGVPAKGNKIVIPVQPDKLVEVEIGVVVNRASLAEDATYRWHIKLCDDAGLTRVLSKDQKGVLNTVDENKPWMLGLDVCVKNNHVANSLKVGTNITLLAILVALVLWIFYAHACKWPKAKFSRVEIDYHDGMGPRPIRMGGAHDLVFTDKKKSDSLLKKIFKCTTKYEEHPFWTHEVKMVSSKTRGRLRVSNLRTFYVVGDTVQKEEFQIVNETGEKVTIVTT